MKRISHIDYYNTLTAEERAVFTGIIHDENGQDWAWLKNGKLHKESGAALEYENGRVFYLEGTRYEEEEYWLKVEKEFEKLFKAY